MRSDMRTSSLYARLPVTVLCAAPGYRARVVNDYMP